MSDKERAPNTPVRYKSCIYSRDKVAIQESSGDRPELEAQCAILYNALYELQSLNSFAMAATKGICLSQPQDTGCWQQTSRGLSHCCEQMRDQLKEVGAELNTLERLIREESAGL